MSSTECPHDSHPAYCTDCMEAPRPYLPPQVRPKQTTAPKGPDDVIEPLSGDFDISYPVYEITPYTEPGTDWLAAIKNSYPHQLRPDGWLYLRSRGRLWALGECAAWNGVNTVRSGLEEMEMTSAPGWSSCFGLRPGKRILRLIWST